MKCVRHTAGDSFLDHRGNEDISDELKEVPLGKKLTQ
jgi:hypothetical protein